MLILKAEGTCYKRLIYMIRLVTSTITLGKITTLNTKSKVQISKTLKKSWVKWHLVIYIYIYYKIYYKTSYFNRAIKAKDLQVNPNLNQSLLPKRKPTVGEDIVDSRWCKDDGID
jgi:amino acid permease